MNQVENAVTISVIVPVYNSRATIGDCLLAIANSSYRDIEIIVVDDGSTDESIGIANSFSVRFLPLSGGPRGPANARNQGANAAIGELLFFVDSDVIIYPDTIAKVVQAFESHPEYGALFGSYDDEPGDVSFLSQYKNLTHAFVHQQAQEEGSTFWSGCGAIRKSIFLQAGGFDVARYPRPSIEDIDLGRRIKVKGSRIWVNKEIKVKHLKHWTLKGLLKTDIVDRAIPWTLLIMRERNLPNDLNLDRSQRVSALLTVLLAIWTVVNLIHPSVILLNMWVILFLLFINTFEWKASRISSPPVAHHQFYELSAVTIIGIIAWLSGLFLLLPLLFIFLISILALVASGGARPVVQRFGYQSGLTILLLGFILLCLLSPPGYSIGATLILAVIIWLNFDLYRYLKSRQGIVFALGALPMQLLYYIYSQVAFFVGVLLHYWSAVIKPKTEITERA